MTSSSPSVACCLLNWNGKQDTLACLDALRHSSYPARSILVADNGSTDGSVEAIRNCSTPVELLLMGQNLGFAVGNNALLKKALEKDFEYVWLLNNDTLPEKETLAELVRKAESDSRIGAVGSVCYYAHAPTTVQVWAGAYVNRWIGFARNTTTPKPDKWFGSIYGASMLLRCAALRETGLLDEGYFFSWEETDLCLRMVDAGWRLAAAPDSKLLHKHGGSTGSTHPLLDRYTTASRLRGIHLYSPLPHVMVPIYAAFRLVKRGASLDWERLRRVWEGIQDYRRSFRTAHSPAALRRARAQGRR